MELAPLKKAIKYVNTQTSHRSVFCGSVLQEENTPVLSMLQKKKKGKEKSKEKKEMPGDVRDSFWTWPMKT